ncbi:MAG: ABC transporter ATP-binding protein [Pseudomonadota bacterium]|nr:ABC transporter ATP-binding protein [Pseudomonadota bacterium]
MSKSPDIQPAISVQSVSKRYENNTHAVKNVSFSIMPGDFTVLLGLNGAGKTSLISMITGLSNLTSGKILIHGHDTVEQSFSAKRFMGIVPQEINFNPFLTVRDSLTYHGGYYGASPDEVLQVTTPLLKKARLWNKLHTETGSLSGGMKRILMLIRALAHKPSILILDEPTANLDIEIREIIWDILKSLKQDNLAILLTTHNLQEAQDLCENLLILHKGKLLRNQSIHEAITSLQERFYTVTFTEAFQEQALSTLCFTKLDDKKITLRLPASDNISQVLKHLSDQNLFIEDISPSSNQLEQLLRQATSNG